MSRIERFKADLRNPLYANGYALMANTAITSFFGLIYWILAAHRYSTADFGRGFAQVAAVMVISALTQLNFTSVLLRYLPRAGVQSGKLIVTAYAIAVAFAAVAATIVIVIINLTTSDNFALHMDTNLSIWFAISCCGWSIFNLQDGAMTGLRRTIWVPVENGTFNIGKIALLFALHGPLGANGILVSTTLPVLLALIPVNFAIFARFLPRHNIDMHHKHVVLDRKEISKYIAGDYVSTLFGQAMSTFMPVLVAGVLGATANGYFSTAQTMALALDLIAFNLAQSLTVEGSVNGDRVRQLTIDAAKRVALLVLPLGAILFIAAPYLLHLFPSDYSQNATLLLRLLIISSIPKAVIAVHIAMARVNGKTHRNAITAAMQAVGLIGGSVVLMKWIGINGVGYAAISGQTIVALAVLPWMVSMLHHQGKHYRPRGA